MATSISNRLVPETLDKDTVCSSASPTTSEQRVRVATLSEVLPPGRRLLKNEKSLGHESDPADATFGQARTVTGPVGSGKTPFLHRFARSLSVNKDRTTLATLIAALFEAVEKNPKIPTHGEELAQALNLADP